MLTHALNSDSEEHDLIEALLDEQRSAKGHRGTRDTQSKQSQYEQLLFTDKRDSKTYINKFE